jgi:hypothetical protein
MPFLLIALTVLSAAAFWYFRMRDVGQAAGDIVDQAQRVRGAYRRRQFRQKVGSSPINAVDDPVLAATAMLVALAALSASPSGRLSEKAEAAIKSEMRAIMNVAEIDEAFTFAKWVADHAADPNHLSLKFSKLWLTELNATERADLLAMASRVAEVEGPPSILQRDALVRLKDRLGLTRP